MGLSENKRNRDTLHCQRIRIRYMACLICIADTPGENKMIKLVIFDMDGLMFDTERATCRAFMERAAAWGYQPTTEQYLQLLGLNAQAIQEKYFEFFGDKDIDAPELYRQVGERKLEILQTEGMPVKKGLFELLDVLDELGVKKAVASGSGFESIERNIADAGLTGRFDFLMTTEWVKRGKPYPDVFLAICDKLAVAPEETLVLEDAQNGVRAALAGGIRVINVPDMLPLSDELAAQCVSVEESLADVIPYIRKEVSGQAHFPKHGIK